MTLEKHNYTITSLLLLFLNCSPTTPPSCTYAENLYDWEVYTNTKVLSTDLIFDRCNRNIGVTSKLNSGGELKISRYYVPNTKESTTTLEVNAGLSGTCIDVTISVDGVSKQGTTAKFQIDQKNHKVEISVKTTNQCTTSIIPTLYLG